MYRSTTHSVTGISPAKIFFGREIRTKIPSTENYNSCLFDNVSRHKDLEMKQKGKKYADRKRNAKISYLKEGDMV